MQQFEEVDTKYLRTDNFVDFGSDKSEWLDQVYYWIWSFSSTYRLGVGMRQVYLDYTDILDKLYGVNVCPRLSGYFLVHYHYKKTKNQTIPYKSYYYTTILKKYGFDN